jgi:hypothetical protein
MSITVEFKIDCTRGQEFIRMMRQVRLIHLRNGAYSWRLHEDLTRSNTFRLELVVPSWNEHLLQRQRMTKAEKDMLEKGLESPHGRYSARRTDLPIGEQRAANASAMYFQCVHPANKSEYLRDSRHPWG